MSRENRKRESTKRAAKGAGTLAKLGASAVATAVFGPVGGVATALGAQLIEHARGLFTERRDRRIEQFHEFLLGGVPENERATVIRRLIADDDALGHYASILEKVAQDDEAEKVPLYANLLRHLANQPEGQTRPKELQRHVIRSLRELAAADVVMLRKFEELNRAFPAKPGLETQGNYVQIDQEKSLKAQEESKKHREFIESRSPLEAAGIRRLEYAGLIRTLAVWGGDRYELTPIGLTLLMAVTEERSSSQPTP